MMKVNIINRLTLLWAVGRARWRGMAGACRQDRAIGPCISIGQFVGRSLSILYSHFLFTYFSPH